jgi:putative flippase GtrA
MKKSDIVIALATGEIVALYFINLFKMPVLWGLTIVFPALSVFCLWLAFLIGKKFLFVFQFAKFSLVGVLATIFDLGSLSFFIAWAGAKEGIEYSIFKGVSFLVATVSKYFVDKFWAFEKKETSGMKKEFLQFVAVTVVGLGVNVFTASLVVNVIGPQFALSQVVWANIGGIIAVLPTFLWNFVGYKFLVFKK